MSAKSDSIYLKSFNAFQDIVDQVQSFEKRNVTSKHTRKRLKIYLSTSLVDFHESVAKPFLVVALAGRFIKIKKMDFVEE